MVGKCQLKTVSVYDYEYDMWLWAIASEFELKQKTSLVCLW